MPEEDRTSEEDGQQGDQEAGSETADELTKLRSKSAEEIARLRRRRPNPKFSEFAPGLEDPDDSEEQ